jgi:hypothetical protein
VNVPPTHLCGHDAAAYALGALEPAEAEAFRAHLDRCIVCRDEVQTFQQVVDALPMGAPQHRAPRGLRRRVLREVEPAPWRKRSALGSSRGRERPRRFALPRPALAPAVVAVGFLAVLGGIGLTTRSPSVTRVIQARITGVSGTAQLRLTGSHAELIVRRLPPPPAGRIYEVWLERGHRPPAPTSALFSVTANGSGDVDVPGSVRGVSAVMVTQEPAGGSLVPTHQPVILARLA